MHGDRDGTGQPERHADGELQRQRQRGPGDGQRDLCRDGELHRAARDTETFDHQQGGDDDDGDLHGRSIRDLHRCGDQTPCTATATGRSLNDTLTVSYSEQRQRGHWPSASATYAETANYLGSTDSETFDHQQGGDDDDGDLPGEPDLHGCGQTPCAATATGTSAERLRRPVTYATTSTRARRRPTRPMPNDELHREQRLGDLHDHARRRRRRR